LSQECHFIATSITAQGTEVAAEDDIARPGTLWTKLHDLGCKGCSSNLLVLLRKHFQQSGRKGKREREMKLNNQSGKSLKSELKLITKIN